MLRATNCRAPRCDASKGPLSHETNDFRHVGRQMFFVVSTGRSGTQTMARVLSQIPGCACAHEPPPELILESSAYRYGQISADTLTDILHATRPPRIDGSVYCEANQALSLIIPVLAAAFPQAGYIWLIRNGLDVVASAYQKQWYSGHSENHDRYEDCPKLEKAWIDGRIHGDRARAMMTDEWAQLDRFARCCWYWAYVNQVIAADLGQYASERSFSIQLEDLLRQLPDLLTWMGLAARPLPHIEQHNRARRSPYHWSEWSRDELRTFEIWCGPVMDRHYPAWRRDTEAAAGHCVFPQSGGNPPSTKRRWV